MDHDSPCHFDPSVFSMRNFDVSLSYIFEKC
jgi:hypothetical protein